jgi:hypothetical protein
MIAGIFGLAMIAGAVMTIIYLITTFFVMKEKDGWRSATIQMLFFAAIVLTGLGASWATHR